MGNTAQAIAKIEDDEKQLSSAASLVASDKKMFLISESGVYNLILSSRCEESKLLKKWVTSILIPSVVDTDAIAPMVRELLISDK